MRHPLPLMLLAVSLIPLSDAFGKILLSDYGASQTFVAWSRFGLGTLMLLPFLKARHLDFRIFLKWQVWFRSLLQLCAILCIFTAFKTEPLANVFGAFFVGPIISYVLSIFLLKEETTWPRALLLALGFCGVLLVVRPGFGMSIGMVFGVLSGIFYGMFLTANRWLSDVALPRSLLLSQLVIATLILTPITLVQNDWPEFTAPVLWFTLFSGLASLLGNLLLIVSYKLAPATRLAPLVYFQLIAATTLSYVVFDVVPDALTIAGLTLLVTSGFATLALRR